MYLQLMTYVRNIQWKNESSNRRKLLKNYHGRNKEYKKVLKKKLVRCSLCVLFNCLYYKKDG